MASTLYAWSPIKVGEPTKNAENPGDTKVIKPGESVTKDGLGLDDEQWAQLLDSGSVRTLQYPDMPETYQDSPVQFLREQARKAADGALTDAQNSEENLTAIQAANAAATGTALTNDSLDPEVAAEMDKQKQDQSSEPASTDPNSGTGTTQVNPQ